MASRRESERVGSSRHCILTHGERNLVCRLENISTTGVLVRCGKAKDADLQQGDTCILEFDDQQLNHRRMKCSVSRRTRNEIGLKFDFLERS